MQYLTYQNVQNCRKNKKVLMRKRKRHTARRVVSTPSVVLTGYPPPHLDLAGGVPCPGVPCWGVPCPGGTCWGVPCPRGYPTRGVLCPGGTLWGVPCWRVPCPGGYPARGTLPGRVPCPGGYPAWGRCTLVRVPPSSGPGWVPP